MTALASRQEIHKMLDNLPPEALPDLLDYLDYLRYRTSRQTLSTHVEEAIRLYVGDEISLSRAAELAGMNYFQFEVLLRQRGIKALQPEVSKTTLNAQRELVDDILYHEWHTIDQPLTDRERADVNELSLRSNTPAGPA